MRQDRREMRAILVPRSRRLGQTDAIADQFDAMARLWDSPGTSGLVLRRHAEATLWRLGFERFNLPDGLLESPAGGRDSLRRVAVTRHEERLHSRYSRIFTAGAEAVSPCASESETPAPTARPWRAPGRSANRAIAMTVRRVQYGMTTPSAEGVLELPRMTPGW